LKDEWFWRVSAFEGGHVLLGFTGFINIILPDDDLVSLDATEPVCASGHMPVTNVTVMGRRDGGSIRRSGTELLISFLDFLSTSSVSSRHFDKPSGADCLLQAVSEIHYKQLIKYFFLCEKRD